jgi:4-diphosphocytidyl-2-C-methyl-D-erythritol kinase
MRELTIESYGKINLALDVLYKRPDNYHEIKSVMQQISLKDKLIFTEINDGIVIESDNKELPLDSSNLIYKAWEKMKSISGINRGIKVKIEKNIPIAAGLAGGSSNGAATLKALNRLWDLNYTKEELMKIGLSLGADVPFCILGGTAKAEGIGEILTPIESFKDKYILLGNPGVGISSAYAYGKISVNPNRYDIDGLIKCMGNDDLSCVAKKMKNKMEDAIIKEHPIIQEIKKIMIENGALNAIMSGSGPTVFGLFHDLGKMNKAFDALLKRIDKVYKCTTI